MCEWGCKLFVEGEEVFDSVAVGFEGFVSVGAVNKTVDLGVSFQQGGRHCKRVVKVGQRGRGIFLACIKDCLRGDFDGGALFIVQFLRPRIVVIDQFVGIAVIALDASANNVNPCHVHGGG